MSKKEITVKRIITINGITKDFDSCSAEELLEFREYVEKSVNEVLSNTLVYEPISEIA